ncbi:hypothetical protein [Acidovorax sp. NCPPB 3576]|uniref:hypothetical protein n=1 Tax=Acidovorax sp. NCPPB 3576 TaxID=2940488 RepID=UPI00234A69E2|nr:hypothetical protein [Acidovorax sp. NCPPB 3576]WCM89317.1 hypothetical protein M5C98_04505 [Acidovorax sp. NCPPB 3576]
MEKTPQAARLAGFFFDGAANSSAGIPPDCMESSRQASHAQPMKIPAGRKIGRDSLMQ